MSAASRETACSQASHRLGAIHVLRIRLPMAVLSKAGLLARADRGRQWTPPRRPSSPSRIRHPLHLVAGDPPRGSRPLDRPGPPLLATPTAEFRGKRDRRSERRGIRRLGHPRRAHHVPPACRVVTRSDARDRRAAWKRCWRASLTIRIGRHAAALSGSNLVCWDRERADHAVSGIREPELPLGCDGRVGAA